MNARELQTLLQSERPPFLLFVLPPEIFAAARIPGSQNACVYETAFLSQVQALVADRAMPVVVYGAGGESQDAPVAAGQLQSAGYTQVRVFAGGLEEWQTAGLPTEGDGLPAGPVLPDGTYDLDTAQSVIRWTGRNLFNHHSGTVRTAAGEIVLRQGGLQAARFTVDMGSIRCEDLADPAYNAMLIAHLRTADFFDVGNYPAATFIAGSVEKIGAATPGTPNFLLRGTFTLRGVSRPLEFPVLIACSDDARRITAQGQFELDRTEYGSHYGSGKFFRFLGKHLVNDHIHLHVKIHADRREPSAER